jgi:squalene-hopene/tetraprenyl-beta-curcumene cyclase
MDHPRKTRFIALGACGLVAAAIAAHDLLPARGGVAGPGRPPAPGQALTAVEPASCAGAPGTVTARAEGNPKARAAAQRGLDFLVRESKAWQEGHACYGCHVHAVTLEAMSVGRHHQYALADAELQRVSRAMLTLPGGARGPVGFSYHDASLLAPSKAFGGAAFARWDQWVDASLRDDLVKTGEELLGFQQEDGSIKLDWVNPPVGAGVIQGTYQAAQTWRQVYARTADDRWLPPLQKAERYLAAAAAGLGEQTSLQELDYALLGLSAAGMGASEELVAGLLKRLLARQNQDGGFGFLPGESSNAFATGQALYALRMLGLADGDPTIDRGTSWLVANQAEHGGWSNLRGYGKAEAMWGVLGLVSVDVLTVAAAGLMDGDRLDDRQSFRIEARDNAGGGVTKVELFVDDVRVASRCGASLEHVWDTTKAESGKHVVDLMAWNAKGQSSRRRLELYSGRVAMTQVGARATEKGAMVSFRDIGRGHGRVEMQILSADKTKQVAKIEAEARRGANSLSWNDAAPAGKYNARLIWRDDKGEVVQSEDVSFVRASAAEQRAGWGELEGAVKLPGGGVAANAPVDLVDEGGNVVASTRSTAEGQYRFKNVDAGKYKLRVRKQGFDALEKDVHAEKARPAAKSDFELKAK